MNLELANMLTIKPDVPPPTFGVSFVIKGSSDQTADEFLKKIDGAWSVIAHWNNIWIDSLDTSDTVEESPGIIEPSFDEDLGEFDTIPKWLQLSFNGPDDPMFVEFSIVLYERDWLWWTGAVCGSLVKIDIDATSWPASFWPIRYVIEKAGGTILYEGVWMESSRVELLNNNS